MGLLSLDASNWYRSEMDACVPSILDERTASLRTNGLISRCVFGMVSPMPDRIDTALDALSSKYIIEGVRSTCRGKSFGRKALCSSIVGTRLPDGLR